MITTNDPILYILMRNDLNSLNSGKACAQASHATSEFEYKIRKNSYSNQSHFGQMYDNWIQDRVFGTTIVLEAPRDTIEKTISSLVYAHIPNYKLPAHEHNLENHLPFLFGYVIDPTYPVSDGLETHLVKLTTCAWIFGSKSMLNLDNLDTGLPLMR